MIVGLTSKGINTITIIERTIINIKCAHVENNLDEIDFPLDSFYFMLHIHLSYSYQASSEWKPYLHTSTHGNGRRPDHLWVWHKEGTPNHRHLFWLISWIPQFANNHALLIADTTKIFSSLPPSWGCAIVCYSWLFRDLLICRFSADSRTSSAVHSSHNTTEEKVPRLCCGFALITTNKSLDLNKDGFCIFTLQSKQSPWGSRREFFLRHIGYIEGAFTNHIWQTL